MSTQLHFFSYNKLRLNTLIFPLTHVSHPLSLAVRSFRVLSCRIPITSSQSEKIVLFLCSYYSTYLILRYKY